MKHGLFHSLASFPITPRHRRLKPARKVAIVIPLSNRPDFDSDEKISLRHLQYFLGRYDKYLVAPKDLPIQLEGFRVKRFSNKFFGSAAAHNRLTYTPAFYRAFADYEYIFFYHLDSLVFSDQLLQWCERDLDYIGPPWIPCPDTPWIKEPFVGNGGFTLIRINAALEVLYRRHRIHPGSYWLDLFARNGARLKPVIRVLRTLRKRFPHSKLISRPVEEWDAMENPSPNNRNNDMFWSTAASYYFPEFKVASVPEGLRFAFETAPQKCFELNHRQLPFGCHAWARYDRQFWEPFLLMTS